MTREMMKQIKERKERAAELTRYANPKSKNRPTAERITEILAMHIPYRGEKPTIAAINVTEYHKNSLIETVRIRVDTADGKAFIITAYNHLKGRTPEEKVADKTATFPSGLFVIFHDEVKA